MEKVIDIKKKYSHELNEINYILQNLEIGRYYESTGARMDGSLATNIQKLKKNLNELFDKIEYNEDSVSDEIKSIVKEKGL
ncbi:hypothetical protein HYH38_08355 [Clostridium botulinum]|uniref:hypothetical protein n=1 Tax=Clostridium botulinum TaxID=1491 RepID=UPI001C9B64D4|nr:hypothetical protein [Clostridium botulinum]MBY6816454.1 hypothetical protein [Clostridium botulinum]MBY6827291.1 hypothetical protein [Clostridium botulinum]MBY6859239.1 hypothetical protein [Clostridium botulinum]MBY7041477.1 hypothetical protein [Clostridium botulinum]